MITIESPSLRRVSAALSVVTRKLRPNVALLAGLGAFGLLSACSGANTSDENESLASDSLTSAPAVTRALDDAFVSSQFPNEPHGTDSFLTTGTVGSNDHAAYLMFSVSGIPADAHGVNAKLSVQSQTTASGTINARCAANSNWTGSTLTWNDRPGLSAGVLSSVGSTTAGNISTFDVSSCVTGNGTFTLVLEEPTGPSVRFDSAQGGTAPALAVTYNRAQTAHAAFGVNLAGEYIGSGRPAPFAILRTYHQQGDTTLDPSELAAIAAHSHVHTSMKAGHWSAVANGDDDGYLKPFLLDLKARGGSAVYFSLHHEMDGDDGYGTPHDYVLAAQHVWNLAQRLGVNAGAGGNVYWVWTVTSYGTHTAGYGYPNRVTPYYPGDAYVDYLGDDVYNFQGCKRAPFRSFHDELQPMLDWRISEGHLKPIFLPEVGTSETSDQPQGAWITDMHADLKTATRAPVVAVEYYTPKGGSCVVLDGPGEAAYHALGNDPYFSLTTPKP